MNSFIKKLAALTLTLTLFMNNVLAFSLNEHAKEFYQTQTGSYLHAMYPMLKPEEAVKAAIDHVVTKHKNYIDTNFTSKGLMVFDYTKKQEEIDKLYKNVETFLEKEITLKDTHCIFYHGHTNAMSAYNETLHELMTIAGMKDLGKGHPLHYKSSELNKIHDANDFLNNNKYLKAHHENVKNIKEKAKNLSKDDVEKLKADPDPDKYRQYLKDLNCKPFNLKNNLGLGKAADASPYARDHLHCVNFSLFGNSENPGESSFLFFLTSGNIGKMDRYLTTRLFQDTGILSKTATAAEIDQKLSLYEKIFAEKMALAGGGMMQICMKNEIVDKYSFASWAKGVPYFMNKKNGKFATRDHNNKPVPLLANGSKELVRPSVLNMIKLYKKDPVGFSRKFSHDGKTNLEHLDRAQARLFVNPKIFANNKLVEVNKITRHDVNPADVAVYKSNLHKQLMSDLGAAVANKQLTPDFFDHNFSFGKLVKFVFSKETKLSDIVDVIVKASKTAFHEVIGVIKEAAGKIVNAGAKILEKIKALDIIDDIMTSAKKVTKSLVNNILKAFR